MFYFRDNYGFVTFRHKVDACEAFEHGNDDPAFPIVDICFGGRRAFCKEKYSDLGKCYVVKSSQLLGVQRNLIPTKSFFICTHATVAAKKDKFAESETSKRERESNLILMVLVSSFDILPNRFGNNNTGAKKQKNRFQCGTKKMILPTGCPRSSVTF